MNLNDSLLGKDVSYQTTTCQPEILFPIARADKRKEIRVSEKLPFYGIDIWNHYELSWLDPKGKPIVAVVEISYDCSSPYIVESKSIKLYFNSFNNIKFKNLTDVQNTIKNDLEQKIGAHVTVRVFPLDTLEDNQLIVRLEG